MGVWKPWRDADTKGSSLQRLGIRLDLGPLQVVLYDNDKIIRLKIAKRLKGRMDRLLCAGHVRRLKSDSMNYNDTYFKLKSRASPNGGEG